MSDTPSQSITSPPTSNGFSLIELMVAITLGLLLTAGMIQLFNSSKVTFRTNDAVARVQENGRFALEILKIQLREAGTLGFCAGQIPITNHLNTGCAGGSDDFFDPDLAVVGWEYSGTGLGDGFTLPTDLDPGTASAGDWDSEANSTALPSQLSGLVVPGSDVLVVRRLNVVDDFTADPGPPPNQTTAASITITGPNGLPEDSIILVTDCSTADLFQNRSNASASALSAGTGSCSNPGPGNNNSIDWSTSYGDAMQTFTVEQVAYYIGLNATTGQPGLYRWNMSRGTSAAQAEEIIEGAESMQILYGFSRAAPNGDGQSINDWLTASNIPPNGWPQVIALRLALSIRSTETADTDNTDITLNLGGSNITAPGDGRIRQPFSTTVALRNRLLVD
ncbi:MAG TPA: PilW family protein [Wenzhouxiangellaceae bacterium]|nr:PilW family protein [Wenzhouxiangellaceae bacterium]